MATESNHRSTSGAGQNRASARQQEARKKRKIIIFVVEILVILIMLVVLFILFRPASEDGSGGLLSSDGPKRVDISEDNLAIHEDVQKETEDGGTMTGYMNIALFGVDAMTDDELYKGSRSDSTMIASVNLQTGDIRLVSVYRDTYLNVGTDSYEKCNAAYSYGGPEQAMRMLNMNLDMDIKHFITVGYKGLSEVIDGLGGVYIDIDEEELKWINQYQNAVAEVLKCDYVDITEPGYQLVDGIQATAYCRIRKTAGDDFKRTARQREVLKSIEEQAKKADYDTLVKVFNLAIDDIYTNLDEADILNLLKNIANYRITEEGGFPVENMRTTANLDAVGSCVIPTDLESNVVWLHQFLFEDKDYTVTDIVLEYSRKIDQDTAGYINKNK